MGRSKHQPGRAGTLLEVKVRNGQRYLYERTRVYEGGKSHSTSKYLYKLPPAKPKPVEEPQASARHRNRDRTDDGRQPKQIPRAAAGGEKTAASPPAAGRKGPAAHLLRGGRSTEKH